MADKKKEVELTRELIGVINAGTRAITPQAFCGSNEELVPVGVDGMFEVYQYGLREVEAI